MKKRKRKTQWWVWLIRLIFLTILILGIWQRFFANDYIPDKQTQLLDSVSKIEQPDATTAVNQDNDLNNNLEETKNTETIVEEEQVQDNSDKPTAVFVLLDVPFVSQAPFAEWEDDRFQDGCEEASVAMAMAWVNNESLSKEQAKQAIIEMSAYELDNYGNYHDTNAADTVSRLFIGHYGYQAARTVKNISVDAIKQELYKGNLILVPTNGQRLNNPYYTAPGPETHMLVIKGFAPETKEFITNDPGTKRGESYRYNVSVLVDAIFDYPTGNHESVTEYQKAMIIVEP